MPVGPSPDSQHRTTPGRYRAFISYSHAADKRVATALQGGLHQLTKPLVPATRLSASKMRATRRSAAAAAARRSTYGPATLRHSSPRGPPLCLGHDHEVPVLGVAGRRGRC